MDYSLFYDKTDVNSIVEYSKKLEGKTFAEIISEKVGSSHDEIIKAYGNKARKADWVIYSKKSIMVTKLTLSKMQTSKKQALS